jgi:hypothetical protein
MTDDTGTHKVALVPKHHASNEYKDMDMKFHTF